ESGARAVASAVASEGSVIVRTRLVFSMLLSTACGSGPMPIPDGGPSDAGSSYPDTGPVDASVSFLATCQAELQLNMDQCMMVAGWRLPAALPSSHGNRYANDMNAAMLGRQLFFDDQFSVVPNIACATCHHPDLAFQDGLAVPEV